MDERPGQARLGTLLEFQLRGLGVAAALSVAAAAFGQATKPDDPINTSRPSFSDSPVIVPVRHLQLETGFTDFRRSGLGPGTADAGEALFRYGLAPRVELRLQAPNYDFGLGSGLDGFDDTSLAISCYLGKFAGLDVGVIPTVAIPTGLRSPNAVPSFTLNASHDLGGGRSLGTTLGQTYGAQLTQSLATLVYVQPLGGPWTGFVEAAGFFDPLDQPQNYAHVGVQFLLSKTSQIDVHGGVGLNDAASHAFVGAGYSVRF